MHFKPIPALAIAAITCSVFAVFSGTAAGQTNPGAPATTQTPPPGEHADEVTVQSFAVALAAVEDVKTEYTQKIREAREPEVATRLQREAQSEMIKAVETKGLTVNQYNLLAQQMQVDLAFRQRVERVLQQK